MNTSPFPGMDPFLEDSAEWLGLYARLIVALSDHLAEAVAPDYVVAIEQPNWLEIDLLRAGERPPEVAGKSDYYALLKRGSQTDPYEVWYFDLRDSLPTIWVNGRIAQAGQPD